MLKTENTIEKKSEIGLERKVQHKGFSAKEP